MKLLATVLITLLGLTAYAQEKSRVALDCKARKIIASSFEESFSVDEYPQVKVIAVDKSNPLLPSIVEEFTVSIGANEELRAGRNGVVSVRSRNEGQGHQKYVVAFSDGNTITVEAQRLGKASLTSLDGSLEAVLKCK